MYHLPYADLERLGPRKYDPFAHLNAINEPESKEAKLGSNQPKLNVPNLTPSIGNIPMIAAESSTSLNSKGGFKILDLGTEMDSKMKRLNQHHLGSHGNLMGSNTNLGGFGGGGVNLLGAGGQNNNIRRRGSMMPPAAMGNFGPGGPIGMPPALQYPGGGPRQASSRRGSFQAPSIGSNSNMIDNGGGINPFAAHPGNYAQAGLPNFGANMGVGAGNVGRELGVMRDPSFNYNQQMIRRGSFTDRRLSSVDRRPSNAGQQSRRVSSVYPSPMNMRDGSDYSDQNSKYGGDSMYEYDDSENDESIEIDDGTPPFTALPEWVTRRIRSRTVAIICFILTCGMAITVVIYNFVQLATPSTSSPTPSSTATSTPKVSPTINHAVAGAFAIIETHTT